MLPLEFLSHPSLVSPFYTYDYSISQEIIALSRAIRRGSEDDPESLLGHAESTNALAARLCEDRSSFAAEMLPVLFHCLNPKPCSVSDTTLFTDYLPWIRYMVDVDNALEELISPPGTQQSRRQTRNSKKAAQERHIQLDTAELEILSRTAFRIDQDEDAE